MLKTACLKAGVSTLFTDNEPITYSENGLSKTFNFRFLADTKNPTVQAFLSEWETRLNDYLSSKGYAERISTQGIKFNSNNPEAKVNIAKAIILSFLEAHNIQHHRDVSLDAFIAHPGNYPCQIWSNRTNKLSAEITLDTVLETQAILTQETADTKPFNVKIPSTLNQVGFDYDEENGVLKIFFKPSVQGLKNQFAEVFNDSYQLSNLDNMKYLWPDRAITNFMFALSYLPFSRDAFNAHNKDLGTKTNDELTSFREKLSKLARLSKIGNWKPEGFNPDKVDESDKVNSIFSLN